MEMQEQGRLTGEEGEGGTGEGGGGGTGGGGGGGGGGGKRRTVPYFSLFQFAKGGEYAILAVGFLGACVHGACTPLAVFWFGKLIDSVGVYIFQPQRLYQDASKYALIFVYVGLASFVSGWLEISCWSYSSQKQTTRMRIKYLKAILSKDVGFYDTEASTGEIIVGFSNDTLLVQESIGEKAGVFVHQMARFVGGLAVAFSLSWKLTLLTLAVVPLIALCGAIFAFTMVGLQSNSQKSYIKAGEIVQQVLSQVRTVYSFVGEEKAVKSYVEALRDTMKLGIKGGLAKGLGIGFVYGFSFLIWALLLWYAGRMVQAGEIRGGPAFVAIFSSVVGGVSIGQAMPSLSVMAKGKAAGYTILEMIRQSSDSSANQEGKTLSSVVGHIQFQSVVFSYPSRPNVLIFDGLSLDVPPGKVMAIVGGSGSGKSTVVSLIERFYDPNSGQVLLDGHDIKTLQTNWLRKQIGLVNQEPALFAMSVGENIGFGKDDVTPEEIDHAARTTGVHGFVSQLPAMYETQVGERGLQLSGGQKQRIALARAVIKNPAILLLDEATSALDSESEKGIQDALANVMVGRTCMVVAHRLSTVRNADTIAVLEQGKVIEMGTHDELIASGGAYAMLVKLQASGNSKQPHLLEDKRHSKRFSNSSSFAERNFSFRLSGYSDTSITTRYDDEATKKTTGAASSSPSSSHSPSLKKLIKMNSSEWPYVLVGSIGAILAGAAIPLMTLGASQALVAFYSMVPGYLPRKIRQLALLFCGGSVLTMLAFLVENYFFGIMGENITLRTRELMLSAILRFEIGWFENESNSSGLISSRLSSDALMVRSVVADLLCTLVHNLSLVATSYVIAFYEQWRMALVTLATLPLTIASAWAERQFINGFSQAGNLHLRANRVAGEGVSNIRTVAAFCGEEKVVDLFSRELSQTARQTFWVSQIAGLGFGTSQLVMYCSYGMVLWYGAKLISEGITGFGPMVTCFNVLLMTSFGIAETLLLAPNILEGIRTVGSVFEILERKTEIDPDDPKAESVTRVEGKIEFRSVSFHYPSRPDVKIFEDFNLKIPAGKSLALVGTSGSGKSSIIALIARFYDPVSGHVMVDDIDMRKLRLHSLRRRMALVQQEPSLFGSSIYENIAYGCEEVSEAEVVEAAKAANAHGFISGLPEGYRTQVGERGVMLSGGQKQRIAIARAVLRNPAILLLDEATSALDAESERAVQRALDVLMQGRTSVVVAHRLTTVRNVGTIAVLLEGKIVESGRHADLASKDGAYARMLKIQNSS